MDELEQKMRAIARSVYTQMSAGDTYSPSNIPLHVHNGSDSSQISQEDIVQNLRCGANITFAQDATLYRIATGSAPRALSFSGQATRSDYSFTLTPNNYVFTVTAANATAGAVYTNSGISFTVVTTIVGGTTLATTGASDPAASGTLTKTSGTGDATITYSVFSSFASYNATVGATYTNNSKTFTILSTITGGSTLTAVGTGAPTSSGTLTKATGSGDSTITFASITSGITVRAHCEGNCQIGNSIYIQPGTSNSTTIGGPLGGDPPNYVGIQTRSDFLIDSSVNPPIVKAQSGIAHIVDVKYWPTVGTSINARLTVMSYTSDTIVLLTSLSPGWTISGNLIVT